MANIASDTDYIFWSERMITLRTGLPRSGKTHSHVRWLRDLIKSWATGKNASDTRTVYSNVKGLKLPHKPLPITDVVFDPIEPQKVISYSIVWSDIADGSLVCIDEAQDTFPPMGVGQKTPPHVAFLNTHGHRGLDIELITQHPKLLNNAVRRLTGKHLHFRKNTLKVPGLWFVPDAITYEWDHCEDGLQGLRHAVMGSYSYSKDVNDLYMSASEHRRPKFDRPWWIWVPVVLLPFGVYASVVGMGKLGGMFDGKTVGQKAQTAVSKPAHAASAPLAAPSQAASSSGAVSAVPVEKEKDADVVAGCARLRDVCRCYTSTARVVPKPLEFCMAEMPVVLVRSRVPALQDVPDQLLDRPFDSRDVDMVASAKRYRASK